MTIRRTTTKWIIILTGAALIAIEVSLAFYFTVALSSCADNAATQAAELRAQLPYRAVVGSATGSMRPLYQGGERILVVASAFTPEAIPPGTPIVFCHVKSEAPVLHLLKFWAGPGRAVTRGINNDADDFGYLTEERFVGRVVNLP